MQQASQLPSKPGGEKTFLAYALNEHFLILINVHHTILIMHPNNENKTLVQKGDVPFIPQHDQIQTVRKFTLPYIKNYVELNLSTNSL